MSSNIKFTLQATDDGKEVFTAPLSYDALANIVSNYPDHDDSNELFLLAARHPAATVRENVAYKDHLSLEAIDILAKDTSVAVLRNLVRSSAFREHATHEMLEKLINLDIEIAQSIANYIDSFKKFKSCTITGRNDSSQAVDFDENNMVLDVYENSLDHSFAKLLKDLFNSIIGVFVSVVVIYKIIKKSKERCSKISKNTTNVSKNCVATGLKEKFYFRPQFKKTKIQSFIHRLRQMHH